MSKIAAVRDGPRLRLQQANSTRVPPVQASETPATQVAEPAPAVAARDWSSVGERLLSWRMLPAVVLILLTAVGIALRLAVVDEAILADELSTYWIISTNGLGGVVSTVNTDAEITPPLFFVASWLATQVDLTPELARVPSLVAGAASIPVIYMVGLRTVGRPAGLVAAAITALSPFMIYYSAEARGYALMMLMLMLSTLAMLVAVDTRRARWWVVYAVSSCAAVYTHYTCVFALAAQFLWLLWAHPEARKPALIANIGAAVAFLPWLSGLRNDLDSPTTEILSALTPFDWHNVGLSLSHMAVGYPYSILSLEELPGVPALVLFSLAVLVAIVGVAATALREGGRTGFAWVDARMVLVVALALSVPAGEAIVSAIGTNIFGGRNLAAGWPAFALVLAALLIAAGPRLRYVAVALAMGCFVLAAGGMLDERNQRPNYEAAANFINREGGPSGVVIDGAVLSPGPYSPLEVALGRSQNVFRFAAPFQRDHPFGVFDRVMPEPQVFDRAVAAAGGGPIFVVWVRNRRGPQTSLFPPNYRLADSHIYRGNAELTVQVWADRG
jgi:Dolichyl-phosphate-mannose-protein mannosyltransferase